MALPTEPTVFIKANSAICGPDDATSGRVAASSSTTRSSWPR